MTGTNPAPKGHLPTLIACWLHFDVSFMLWVLLGALGVYIAEALGLSPAQKGLLVSVPLLGGSLLRVPLGLAADRFGGRRVGASMLLALFIPLAIGWRGGDNFAALLGVGLMLGIAGASFAVALPLASRWYPRERQGLIMGLAAVGNSGATVSLLLAPRLAERVGWQNVIGWAMVPLAIAALAFVLMAKDSPDTKRRAAESTWRASLAILGQRDLWWFCLFYSITFGGYVGLSSFLPLYLRDGYGLSPAVAGTTAAVLALMGSAARPLGGHLADRWGGTRVLIGLLFGIGVVYALAAGQPSETSMVIILGAGMACLGLGNGAVFQLVPQRFRSEIGVATGVVGAIGGLGGFLLPTLLGGLKQTAGSFGPGFALLAGLSLCAGVVLHVLTRRQGEWRLSWRAASLAAAED